MDAGCKDNIKEDVSRRSTSFVKLLEQLSKEQTVGGCTIKRDEYNVDEDNGEEDASGVNDIK